MMDLVNCFSLLQVILVEVKLLYGVSLDAHVSIVLLVIPRDVH